MKRQGQRREGAARSKIVTWGGNPGKILHFLSPGEYLQQGKDTWTKIAPLSSSEKI